MTLMFEKASRLHLRFDTPVGPLAVEDLWQLPLTSDRSRTDLDGVARGLDEIVKASAVSFVTDSSEPDEELQLKFDIVKHIIKVKREELATATKQAANASLKLRLQGILASRADTALEGKSDEELKALIDQL